MFLVSMGGVMCVRGMAGVVGGVEMRRRRVMGVMVIGVMVGRVGGRMGGDGDCEHDGDG
jgi:hypothetical protein